MPYIKLKGRCTLCGIAGFIGRSKHPTATFELMTKVFTELEIRGEDASGFWGTQADNGKIMFHKEATKSSLFVKTPAWKQVGELNPDLLIVHARATSMGLANTNKNNHPFVSTDMSIALVHNGTIPLPEYEALVKKYAVNSKCDSEVILRIFEAAEDIEDSEYDDHGDKDVAKRLRGFRDIWSQIIRGQMAVGIGERLSEGGRRLWLFRNKGRTLWLIDLRNSLGQIFFCSAPEIWSKAVESCVESRSYIKKKTKLIDIPDEEIWMFQTTPKEPVVLEDPTKGLFKKFTIQTEGFASFQYSGEPKPIKVRERTAEIVSRLDKDEEVIDTSKKIWGGHSKAVNTSGRSNYSINHSGRSVYGSDEEQETEGQSAVGNFPAKEELSSVQEDIPSSEDIKEITEKCSELCKKIKKTIVDLEVAVSNKSTEQGVDPTNAQLVLESLKSMDKEIEGNIRVIED